MKSKKVLIKYKYFVIVLKLNIYASVFYLSIYFSENISLLVPTFYLKYLYLLLFTFSTGLFNAIEGNHLLFLLLCVPCQYQSQLNLNWDDDNI